MTPYWTPHTDAGWHFLLDRAFNSYGADQSFDRSAPRSVTLYCSDASQVR